MKKRLMGLLLSLLMLLSLLPAAAFAEEPEWSTAASVPASAWPDPAVGWDAAAEAEAAPLECVNPLHGDLETEAARRGGLLASPNTEESPPLGSEAYAATPAEAAKQLRDGLRAGEETIYVRARLPRATYGEDGEHFEEICSLLWSLAMEVSTDGLEGDYLCWKWHQRTIERYSALYDEENVDLTVRFQMTYLGTTADQEAEMAAAADAVIESFGFTAETSAYDKIRTVYDYLTDNVRYASGKAGTPIYHTAYSAMIYGETVCQGYASLLYYMLWRCGVPCRFIAGRGSGADHAWNTVWLRGHWYSVDATWDAGEQGHRWFLRGRDTGFYGTGGVNSHAPFTDAKYQGLYTALVEATAAGDYGVRRAADDGGCTLHSAAETTYVTDSGEVCSWCSVCGQSVTHPLWQGGAALQADKTELLPGETLRLKAVSEGAELARFAIREAAVVDGEYVLGDAVSATEAGSAFKINYTPETEGLYGAVFLGYTGGWGYGSAVAYFEVLSPDWSYTVTEGCAAVTACRVGGSTALIPDTLGGYPVTAVASGAFDGCGDLELVAIPAGVTAVAPGAFSGCTGLTAYYFGGTSDMWDAVAVGENNDPLTRLTGRAMADGPETAAIIALQNLVADGEECVRALCYCAADQAADVCAARYDGAGRFLGVEVRTLTPGGLCELDVPRGEAAALRFFALVGGVPLCASADAPPLA